MVRRYCSYNSELCNMGSVYIINGILIKNRTDKTIDMKTIRAMINSYENIFIEINKKIYIFTTEDKVQAIKNLYGYKLFAQHIIFYTKERLSVTPPHAVVLILQAVAEFLFSELIDKKPLDLEDYNNLANHIYTDRIKEPYGTTNNYTVIKHDSSELII